MKSPLPSVLVDRRFWLGTPGRVVAVLLIVNFAIGGWQQKLAAARQANLLASAPVEMASGSTRYDRSVGEHLSRYWSSIPDSRQTRLVILAGMSQMYAINEQQPGDEIIAERLDDRLAPHGTRVFGLAAPNLGNEEGLFLLAAVSSSAQTKPAAFVYAMCFDKMRVVDIRPGYLAFIREHPEVRARLQELSERYAQTYPVAASKLRTTLESLDAVPAAEDHSFEHQLRESVGRHVPLVGARQSLNSFFMYDVLYETRNKLLGITNTTKRPIIEGRYEMNKQFLGMMIDEAARQGIQLVLYINPLNPLAENPYVPAQYADFKRWAAERTNDAHVPFANFENIVPKEDWGLFMGGPDFKHFKAAGHLKTAEAIADRFGPVLEGEATPRS